MTTTPVATSEALSFTKMHALGNDYIFFNAAQHPKIELLAPKIANTLCNRNRGIGGDGIICVAPVSSNRVRMWMFNADGSEAEMCGNGLRQLARFAWEEKLIETTEFCVDTKAGERKVLLQFNSEGQIISIRANMGAPILTPSLIPVTNMFQTQNGIASCTVQTPTGTIPLYAVSMGNPHAICFTSLNSVNIAATGSQLELRSDLFPARANIEFAETINSKLVKIRVWERGSGETQACGTGACAVVVAGVLTGRLEKTCNVVLLGGELSIEWHSDGNVFLTGNAQTVFKGVINPALLSAAQN
jgi:diaminopimelate epimerase